MDSWIGSFVQAGVAAAIAFAAALVYMGKIKSQVDDNKEDIHELSEKFDDHLKDNQNVMQLLAEMKTDIVWIKRALDGTTN